MKQHHQALWSRNYLTANLKRNFSLLEMEQWLIRKSENGYGSNLQGERLRSPGSGKGLLPKALSIVESGRNAQAALQDLHRRKMP
jgi:hypothetical protein